MVDNLQRFAQTFDDRHFEQLCCEDLLREAMDNLRAEIEERGAVIRFDKLPHIFGIKTQLVMLFQSLIAGSVRGCPENNPLISVKAAHTATKRIIIFTDNVSHAAQHDDGASFYSIYEDARFEKLKTVKSPETKLCETIMKRHGGALGIETHPLTGTTYFLSFNKSEDEKIHTPAV